MHRLMILVALLAVGCGDNSKNENTKAEQKSGTKKIELTASTPEEFAQLEEEYKPEIYRRIGEAARSSGHGGSDLIMDWHLIDCLRNGLPLDQDVYDAVSWSSIVPLSQWSVLNRSTSVDIPDFTAGAWTSNSRNMDIELANGGGTTNILSARKKGSDLLDRQWSRDHRERGGDAEESA